ncbi:conjugal transfer protein TraN [Sphingorhabdus sp.]|uniref:conjugal transfer protein TraN n=1 Tax=Sphingorhabdus sp. TaxID=1902408 RepID=UPI0025DE12EE|nr:conjugal transfer protein TraN [Sphingorhabdus sp.]
MTARSSWMSALAPLTFILLCFVAPPSMAQTATADAQAAKQDGKNFATQAKEQASNIAEQQVTAETIPGYQNAPSELSDLFDKNDSDLNAAAGSAVGNDTWQTMMAGDANRARIDPASLDDIRARADLINENAVVDQLGSGVTSTSGTCEEVTVSQTQARYEATCDVGVTVSEEAQVESYSCPAGWDLDGTSCRRVGTQSADVSYSCPSGSMLDGTNCRSSQAASISSYSCPSGFTLAQTTCSRAITESATVASYSCATGFILVGTNCQQTITQSATPNYSCSSGYTLSGSSCSQTTTTSATPIYSCPSGTSLSGTTCINTVSQAATPSYSCASGFVLSGTNCVQNTGYAATPSYSCPSGWTQSGSSCEVSMSQLASVNYSCPPNKTNVGSRCQEVISRTATANYSCNLGYIFNGVECGSTETQAANSTQSCNGLTLISGYCSMISSTAFCPANVNGMVFDRSANARGRLQCFYVPARTYSCATGYALTGVTCQSTATQTAIVTYSCNAGEVLAGLICNVTSVTDADVNYSCPNGYLLNGELCSVVKKQDADVSYSCPSGGTLSGTTCEVSNSNPASVSYNCPSGFALSGTTCTQQQTQNAAVSFSCPTGFVLSGSSCSRENVISANLAYSCPANYTLSGSTCSQTQSSAAVPVYSCPAGFSLSGNSCSAIEAQPATPSYACPLGFSLSGTVCSMSVQASAVYSCPQGFELDGTTCRKVLVQAATVTMVCPDGTTLQDGKCYGETLGSSECADLEQNAQCQWVKDTCLDEQPSGACKVTEKTFNCPIPGEAAQQNKEYVCSGDLYCTNGSCETIEREASNEFKDALVAMGAIDQVQKEFDPDAMGLFKGTRETCHKPLFGVINCCAGRVSGLFSGSSAIAAGAFLGTGGAALAGIATQFLTIFACSSAEKQLDVKDRLGLCVNIGSYCSSSLLGVCKTKRKAYCCFESKLTRILQEQGRPQINKPWDKPKTEQCKGFTVDEFSRLDLSTMDFSEIYSEFLEAAKLPNEAQMASDIQTKIQQYYQTNAPGGS